MDKFQEAYMLLDFDLKCPKKCKICEEFAVLFLPKEAEYIKDKTGISKTDLANKHSFGGHSVWIICEEEKNCKFYKFGRCIKRDARSLDCRSYPAVPFLDKNTINIRLDQRCPLVKNKKIPQDFVKKSLLAWKLINPPKWWLELYKNKVEK